MQPFVGDLERLAEQNEDYRHVLFTGAHSQLVAMLLAPAEEIGMERHEVDQVFLIIEGLAEFSVDGALYEAEEDAIVVVPAGAEHNVTNIGDEELRLLTIYAPAQHPAGTVQHVKVAEAPKELPHFVHA
jgi:mannose-6-phosphate isomerase-like protein (cupin superfamily)